MTSVLTELSCSSLEESERNPKEPPAPLATTRHASGNETTTNLDAGGPPSLSELCSKIIGNIGHTVKKAPASPSGKAKKVRRRQKKKKPVAVREEQGHQHGHQYKRMKNFMRKKSQEKSKQTRMAGGLSRQALERAIIVPFELEEFRPSRGINLEPRVYDHKELAALNVNTIEWDGQ